MPAYAFRAAEPQENSEVLEQQLTQEVRECKEVGIRARNYVKRFLMEHDVWELSQIDYPLRLIFEDYVKIHELPSISQGSRLHAFDRMKLHAIRGELQTMAGQKKYERKYTDKVMFLPYDTEIEVAEQLVRSQNKDVLVWDFTRPCNRQLKQQIFECLNYIVVTYESWVLKVKLKALQYLYEYCDQMKISDLEMFTLKQEDGFENYLSQEISVRKYTNSLEF